ncbi:hypothetical protein N2152v2_003914 [Parachlorella kessleri]
MGTRELLIYQADAFTDRAFAGNPAAVCLLPGSALPLADSTRQHIASEMNLSETAFLEALDEGGDFHKCQRFRLRWFTPAVEVPLCGHATLAAAAALFQGEGSNVELLRFETNSGELTVRRQADGSGGGLLCMDFPSVATTADVPAGMGIDSELVKAIVKDTSAVEVVLYAPSVRYLTVVLRDTEANAADEALLSLRPHAQQLEAAYTRGQLTGVIVTAQGGSNSSYDFTSRFFAPWAGIPEDPVTGSAHCVLGPFWAGRLGKTKLRARQCSPRGGDLWVTVDEAAGRVELAGHAVLVMKGHLLLPKEAL